MGRGEDRIGHKGRQPMPDIINNVEISKQLLDHETRAAEQVPLLLGMREDGRALEKAVDSGDTDLGEYVRF